MALTQDERRKLLEEQEHHTQKDDLRAQQGAAVPGVPAGAAHQTTTEKGQSAELLSYWVEGRGQPLLVMPEDRAEARRDAKKGLRHEGGDGGHLDDDERRPGIVSDFQADTLLAAGERAPRPEGDDGGDGPLLPPSAITPRRQAAGSAGRGDRGSVWRGAPAGREGGDKGGGDHGGAKHSSGGGGGGGGGTSGGGSTNQGGGGA